MVRLRNRIAIVLLVVSTVACGSPGTAGQPAGDASLAADRAAIDGVRNAYVAAWNATSADRIAALYTDSAVVLYPNKPAIKDRDGIRAYFASFFAAYARQDFKLDSIEIEVAGSWAFDRGTYQLKAASSAVGDAIEDHGKYLVILTRQADGSWKIARDMDNTDRPLVPTIQGRT